MLVVSRRPNKKVSSRETTKCKSNLCSVIKLANSLPRDISMIPKCVHSYVTKSSTLHLVMPSWMRIVISPRVYLYIHGHVAASLVNYEKYSCLLWPLSQRAIYFCTYKCRQTH